MNPLSEQQLIEQLKRQTLRQYERNLNRDLSQQLGYEVLLRNVPTALDELASQLLEKVQQNELSLASLEMLLDGYTAEFLTVVLQKHRTSCALSNFPQEHNPAGEYLQRVIEAAEASWYRFSQQLQAL
ncbi:hypothetical protein [Oceanobacter mangrovi]|uniref:hypothetical protein n=1 Tax=Oceanobacter mangrovi TaxID=2862510 RepID=UPI001C8D049E|nr:hypothetical protein [Oceanobacter mangrovi]